MDSDKFVERLAADALTERRRARRWGIFFKSLFFIYIFGVTWYALDDSDGLATADFGEHTAVIRIAGVIADGGDTSADTVNRQLRRAFENEQAKGVILQINSPGGSAVEANRIYKEIRRLRAEFKDKKVYAVAGDFCASGGYFIASAADEIYADPASIIGSIGVIFSGFGFVDAIEKLGVERRVITAGSNKNSLDPFVPESPDNRARLAAILDDIHTVFIDAVRRGRGDRLRAAAADDGVFDGRIFSGAEGFDLGLIDGYSDTRGVARDLVGEDTVVYYAEEDWFGNVADWFWARLLSDGWFVPSVS